VYGRWWFAGEILGLGSGSMQLSGRYGPIIESCPGAAPGAGIHGMNGYYVAQSVLRELG
jgi:hypothetical protein